MTNQLFKLIFASSLISSLVFLGGCAEGERGFVPLAEEVEEETPLDIFVTGGGVKGPLANAKVQIYSVELDKGRYKDFNDTAASIFKMFADIGISAQGDQFVLPSGTSASQALDLIKTYVKSKSYIGGLDYLKIRAEQAESLQELEVLLNTYLAKPVDSSVVVELGGLVAETNSALVDRVISATSRYASLKSLQNAIAEVDSLSDELASAESFGELKTLISQFTTNETDSDKVLAWKQLDQNLESFKRSSQSLTDIRNTYEALTYGDNDGDVNLITLALTANDSVAAKNLNALRDKLAESTSYDEAELAIYEAFRLEGLASVKSELRSFYESLNNIDDFKLLIAFDNAMNNFLGVKKTVNDSSDLDTLFASLMSLLTNESELALDSAFLSDEIVGGVSNNRLSSGTTDGTTLLPFLGVGQYRGFVYMAVEATSETIDLNTGNSPLITHMSSIFHTDDILGYGDNTRSDESLYFIKNGVIQRDDAGSLIQDAESVESELSDELLEVRPARFASPLTTVALELAKNKVNALNRQFNKLANIGDYALLNDAQKLALFKNSDEDFKLEFDRAQSIVAKSFNVTDKELPNLFRVSPHVLPHFKYLADDLDNAIQYRASIEAFSSVLKSVGDAASLPYASVLSLLANDLEDSEIDAKNFNSDIAELQQITLLNRIVKQRPEDMLIPGTNKPVSETASLMDEQFAQVSPTEDAADYQITSRTLSFVSPLGGVDTDGDGVLDNSDPLPDDAQASPRVSSGYPGLWSVNVNYQTPLYVPLDEALVVSIPVDEIVIGGSSERLACLSSESQCILVGDVQTQIAAEIQTLRSPAGSTIESSVISDVNGSSQTLQISVDSVTPGNYSFVVQIRSMANAVSGDAEQVYDFVLPVTVIDPASIEFQLVKPVSDTVSADGSVSPSVAPVLQFKATQALCDLYSFCGIDDALVGQYLAVDLLGPAFQSAIQIESNVSTSSLYQSVSSITQVNNELVSSTVLNSTAGDQVSASVKYVGKQSGVELSNITLNVGSTDSDIDTCVGDSAGVADANGDGVVNSLDTTQCFADIIAATTDKSTFNTGAIGETWHFSDDWYFIIRQRTIDGVYLGHIALPKNQLGAYKQVSNLLVDNASRRVYIAYKDAGVGLFDFTTLELSSFVSGVAGNPVSKWQLLDSLLLTENLQGDYQFYSATGDLVNLGFGLAFPTPGQSLLPQIDNKHLKDFSNDFSISYEISSYADRFADTKVGILGADGLSLLAGQTNFGDLIKVNVSTTSANGDAISISQSLYALGTDGFNFNSTELVPEQAVKVSGGELDLSQEGISSLFYVRWFINDSTSSESKFLFNDGTYPFLLDADLISYGDIVTAEVYLRSGADLSLDADIKLASVEGYIVGKLQNFIPIVDTTYVNDNTDLVNGNVKLRLLDPSPNASLNESDLIEPVWAINGTPVAGENELYFPSSSTTTLRFGDVVSVAYRYSAYGSQGVSDSVDIDVLQFNFDHTEFSIKPRVAEEGESLSLDLSRFHSDALDGLVGYWYVNGVRDKSVSALEYPGSKLKYGDVVRLELGNPDVDEDDDVDPSKAAYQGAIATVGLHTNKLVDSTSDSALNLDSDNDGVPNYKDYFRFDANCSVEVEGTPDDIDGDGLADINELSLINASSPSKRDTDGDGLIDSIEVSILTDPTLIDSDGDGYSDGFEYYFGSNPLDASSPGLAADQDNDRDGLLNEDELINGTLVNSPDTDGDGLEDGIELLRGTDPLISDKDNDGLSDGAEVKVTSTDPLVPDTDGDGLEDGFEVGLLANSNPLVKDTNNNGVEDGDESQAMELSGQRLSDTLLVTDLQKYKFIAGNPIVPAGTCYASWMVKNRPTKLVYTSEIQDTATSQQEILFSADSWLGAIRYDADARTFKEPILKGNIDARLISLSYDRNDNQVIYGGFSDGNVYVYDMTSPSPQFIKRFEMPQSMQADVIFDQGDMLVAGFDSGEQQYELFAYNKLSGDSEPVNSSQGVLVSGLLRDAVWQAPDSNVLWFVNEASNTLNQLVLGPLDQSITLAQFVSAESIKTPVYISQENASLAVNFANKQRFDVSTAVFASSPVEAFTQGLYHQQQHIITPAARDELKVMHGESQGWVYRLALASESVLGVVPSGNDALVIYQKAVNESAGTTGSIGFKSVTPGDSNSNGIPQWWERIYPSASLADFNAYIQPGNFVFGEGQDVSFVRSEAGDDGDLDDDGLSNLLESSLGSCVDTSTACPTPRDTDGDGLDDKFEHEYRFSDSNSVIHTLDLLSSDTDGDGLNDYDELNIHGTYADQQDSDGDLVCDRQEIEVYNTNPMAADSDSDGLSDGAELGISVLNCDAPLSSSVYSNPLMRDADNDGLNDSEELSAGTSPHNADTDEDGILDSHEVTLGSNPLNSRSRNGSDLDGDIDSDSDGLSDGFELSVSGTRIDLQDTDGDNIDDFVEVKALGSNPSSTDTDGDLICDRFDNALELAGVFNTSPTLSDSDQDGVSDYAELGITEVDINCDTAPATSIVSDPKLVNSDGDSLSDLFEYEYIYEGYNDTELELNPGLRLTIDPLLTDTDGDFLCDSIEMGISNPGEADTDGDGLTDAFELNLDLTEISCTQIDESRARSLPLVADSDLDGLTDGQEILLTLTDPLDSDSNDNGILDGDEDGDGDGLSNHIEVNITKTDPSLADTDGNSILDGDDDQDGDGLSNALEVQYGTCAAYDEIRCPTPKDSDQDGIEDGEEVGGDVVTNPLESDTDGDGISDIKEIEATDPNNRTDPLNPDSDYDGLSDYHEITISRTRPLDPDSDNDFLIDGIDPKPLVTDTDGDSLVDGIEVLLLGTSATQVDSDNDGLVDGYEVWAYGFDTDTSSETLLTVGYNMGLDLNSKVRIATWPSPKRAFPISGSTAPYHEFEDYEFKEFPVYDIVVDSVNKTASDPFNGDESNRLGTVYIKYISDPSMIDTDQDGLDDGAELLQIEKVLGASKFDPLLSSSNYKPAQSNADNFSLSDPFKADTDNNGVSDADEDADGDYLSNLSDYEHIKTSLIVADTDADGLPDGVEVHITNTDPSNKDSDLDGLDDGGNVAAIVPGYEVLYSADADNPRKVSSSVVCKDNESRISNVGGSDYCFTLTYLSYPTVIDSDSDGVPDLDPDDALNRDIYPLDSSCSKAQDGVIDTVNPSSRQCYSSWLAQQSSISQIRSASWLGAGNVSINWLAFYTQGWDRVVRLQMLEGALEPQYAPHIDVTDLELIALSNESQRLYLAGNDGRVDYQDLNSDLLTEGFISIGGNLAIRSMNSVGSHLLLGLEDLSTGSYQLRLYDDRSALLDTVLDARGLVLPENSVITCSTDTCDATATILTIVSVSAHNNNELMELEIDLAAGSFGSNKTSEAFSALDQPITGPVELSEDGLSVYLGSGHQLQASDLSVSASGLDLLKTYKNSEFSQFSGLLEDSGHFVSIVEDARVVDATAGNKAVFIEETKDSSINNKYYLQQSSNDEVFLQLIPQLVNNKRDALVMSAYSDHIDIMPLGITDQDLDGMPGIFEIFYGLSDADNADKFSDLDGDGLSNIEEYLLATDPTKVDTDEDGISDYQEAMNN